MSKALLVVLLIFGLLFGVAVFGFIYFTSTYNKMVTLDEGVDASWADVEGLYQRRLDLIPNLVETVKGVAGFEKETYTAVAEARSQAAEIKLTPELLRDPQALARFDAAQGQLQSALSRLLVTVERYPTLKANESFLSLQDELAGTENRIAVGRKRFNDAVRGYNVAIKRFPARIVASMSGFESRPYFEAEAGAEKAPSVSFGE